MKKAPLFLKQNKDIVSAGTVFYPASSPYAVKKIIAPDNPRFGADMSGAFSIRFASHSNNVSEAYLIITKKRKWRPP